MSVTDGYDLICYFLLFPGKIIYFNWWQAAYIVIICCKISISITLLVQPVRKLCQTAGRDVGRVGGWIGFISGHAKLG